MSGFKNVFKAPECCVDATNYPQQLIYVNKTFQGNGGSVVKMSPPAHKLLSKTELCYKYSWQQENEQEVDFKISSQHSKQALMHYTIYEPGNQTWKFLSSHHDRCLPEKNSGDICLRAFWLKLYLSCLLIFQISPV